MANVSNDKIIKKKGSNQSEEVSEDLLTIQQMLDNLIQSVVDEVVNKSVGTKKCRKQCNSAEDRLRRVVIDHIQKFRPCISHYRRAHAPYRLYISPEFAITSMYQDFCTEHPNARYRMFIITKKLRV